MTKSRAPRIRFARESPPLVMWDTVGSSVGKLAVGVTEQGETCRIGFLRGTTLDALMETWRHAWPRSAFARKPLATPALDSPILLVGTAFQHAVWRAMARIPAGQVATYGAIARRIGKPKAARAVGAACGANPVPYLVPCHRVVGMNGLGGFSGGLAIKRALLEAENAATDF